MKSKNNSTKIVYYTFGLDLFGYYYIDSFLKNHHKTQKKYRIYNDSLQLILYLDQELHKKYLRNYKIVLNAN